MEYDRTSSSSSDDDQPALKYTNSLSSKNGYKMLPKLEKIEENGFYDNARKKFSSQSSIYDCFKGKFGVKSYLNEFYKRNRKNSDLEDSVYSENLKRKCSFKAFIWNLCFVIGIICVFFGLIGLLVGHFFEEEKYYSITDDGLRIINRNTEEFNYHLDMCKLIGLLLVILGGLLLALSLVAHTFTYYDTQNDLDLDLKETFHASTCTDEPFEKVPISSILKSVQPTCRYTGSMYPPISIS